MPPIREPNGLFTRLDRSVWKTSPRPCGITAASAASVRVTRTGKAKLVRTATKAARNVVSMYSQITRPKRRSSFDEPCASAPATSTKTRIGAMALSAPTKRLPNSAIQEACGKTRPRIAPMTRPIAMRRMRLIELYFFATVFRKFWMFVIEHSPSQCRRGRPSICPHSINKCSHRQNTF